MAKVRIYELARDLGLESKDVLDRAKDLGLDVKTASSGLDEAGVAAVTAALSGATTPAPEAEMPDVAEAAPAPATLLQQLIRPRLRQNASCQVGCL